MTILPNHHWKLLPPPDIDIETLAREANVPPLIALLLYHRGCRTAEAVEEFLNPSPSRLNKPETLPDIALATKRIIAALEKRESILVYGDYDVDGVCGSALLVSVLKKLGGKVHYYIPHRETEGYGVSIEGVEYARNNQVSLIITTDCGSSSFSALKIAKSLGIDVIVTDHHEVDAEALPVLAFVNPKRKDSAYPFRELSGVGVAFKLAWSLLATLGRPKEELIALVDLVGLGTIADMVPLIGENRIIARLGLVALKKSSRPGIRALLSVSGLTRTNLTARDVAFIIAPRLNAAGRVGHAHTALNLLLTESPQSGTLLAQELEKLNQIRQSVEETIYTEAIHLIEKEKLFDQRVIVLAREGWNEGVVGIVAARIVEEFFRPSIVISLKGDVGKGSGRSITGFNLYEATKSAKEHLLIFGGHRYAVGVKLKPEKVIPFTAAINQFALKLPEEVFQPTLQIEAITELSQFDKNVLTALARFEPFGPENLEPVFATLGLEVVGFPRRVGKGKRHLRFKVKAKNTILPAIAWNRSSDLLSLRIGKPDHLDICYTIKPNFSTTARMVLNILDLGTNQV